MLKIDAGRRQRAWPGDYLSYSSQRVVWAEARGEESFIRAHNTLNRLKLSLAVAAALPIDIPELAVHMYSQLTRL